MALAGVTWIGWREGTIGPGLFVNLSSWWLDALAGVAAGLLLVGLWEIFRRTLPSGRRLERELARMLGPLSGSEAMALAVLSGVAEEVFFRGAVQGSWGWIAATLLFALLHTGRGGSFRVWTVFAGAAGLVFAGLMLWRGALLAPILAHFLVNAVNLRRMSVEGPGPVHEERETE